MTIKRTTGAKGTLSKTALLALATPTTGETLYVFSENITETFAIGGESDDTLTGESGLRVVFRAGQVYKASEIDRLFQTPTADSITPNTGGIAGGTAFVIKGDNLEGVSGVTFGGVAATNVKVVNDTTVTGTTPATTAGAKAVVIADDSGNLTKNAFFTYV